MKFFWKPALFFLFCLTITLLINMPVGHLITRVKIPAGVNISQLQGSLYRGQADALVVNQLVFEDFEYAFDGTCLITASLCYRLDYVDGTALIRFIPLSGSVEISQLNIELSMIKLASLSNQLLIKPTGRLHLISDNLKINNGKLADIDATVVWQGAGIVGEDINLGDYQLNVLSDAGKYQFTLLDKEAVLDVEGDGILKPDGSYSLNINLKAKAGLEARVKNALEFVASKKGINQYQVRRSGTTDKRLLSYLTFEDI